MIEVAEGMDIALATDVSARIERFANIVPAWCRRIKIQYDSNNTDAYAVVWVNYSNRNAVIAITGSYLELSHERRDLVIAHELCHIHTSIISDAAEDVLRNHLDGPSLETARLLIRERLESATEDLTYAFLGPTTIRPCE